MAAQDCINVINTVTGGTLTPDEVTEVFERVEQHRKRLVAEGKVDNIENRLRQLVAEDATATKIAAALQRKHAALNAIVRDNIERRIGQLVGQGLDYRKAVLTILEGTARGVEGGRHSVAATKLAYEQKFVGGMLAAFERDRPHIIGRLSDRVFLEDVVREMMELRDGGRPGITKNADAIFAAKTFAAHAEVSRLELNRLGANIGKLDGWAGPQVHDDHKLLKRTQDEWIDAILPKLDLQRTFPDIDQTNTAELRRVLGEVWTTITTGRDNTVNAAERGDFTGPASLARSLGRHRVLHFHDADSWLSYSREYGRGSIFDAMIAHQERAARVAAQMQILGPNPAVMMASLRASLGRRIRNDKTIPANKSRR